MRALILFCCLFLAIPATALAQLMAAQPMAAVPAEAAAPVDPYTVTGVIIDIPVTDARQARDAALVAAERQAFQKFKQQLTAAGDPDAAALGNPSDAQLSRMVQNFEVANERISSRRYTGSFTIRFRNSAGRAAIDPAVAAASQATNVQPVLFRFASLGDWTTTQQRLMSSGPVRDVQLVAIGRGYVRAALHYNGAPDALAHALEARGLVLRQDSDETLLLMTGGL